MEKVKLTFLGTGSAIPTARRNHPAMLLQFKDENILVDCGEGTQRQFRKAKLNLCKITRILITHWHGDHVLGLPGLFMTMLMNGYNKKMEIYGPKGTKEKVRQYFDLIALKGQKLNAMVREVSKGIIFDSKEFFIEAEEMDHDTPTIAYSFIIKEKQRLDKQKLAKLKIANSPLLGELVKGKSISVAGKKLNPRNFIYKEPARKATFIMDTRINSRALKFAKDSDLLICESTYAKDKQKLAKEYGHLSSTDAATIAKKAKAKRLILTHLSQRYDAIPKKLLQEAKKIFKNSEIVEDLDKAEI